MNHSMLKLLAVSVHSFMDFFYVRVQNMLCGQVGGDLKPHTSSSIKLITKLTRTSQLFILQKYSLSSIIVTGFGKPSVSILL